MIAQPLLYVPPEIEVGLLDGSLKIFGSVVRESDTGHIVKHLKTVLPDADQVDKAVSRVALAARRLNAKVTVPVVAGVALVGGTTAYLVRRRAKAKHSAVEAQPACVIDFEASLRTYVEAGQTGALTTDIVDQLIAGLDALKAFSEGGNDVKISLDELVPLFDLVIAHTPRLAEAFHVDLTDLDGESADSSHVEGGVVISLRRHLEAQRSMLADAV